MILVVVMLCDSYFSLNLHDDLRVFLMFFCSLCYVCEIREVFFWILEEYVVKWKQFFCW